MKNVSRYFTRLNLVKFIFRNFKKKWPLSPKSWRKIYRKHYILPKVIMLLFRLSGKFEQFAESGLMVPQIMNKEILKEA